MSSELLVRYSCHACGLREIEVAMPYRPTDMDVRIWMDQHMIVALGRDHAQRSPHCRPESLQDIKIPIDGVQWVGGPPIQ